MSSSHQKPDLSKGGDGVGLCVAQVTSARPRPHKRISARFQHALTARPSFRQGWILWGNWRMGWRWTRRRGNGSRTEKLKTKGWTTSNSQPARDASNHSSSSRSSPGAGLVSRLPCAYTIQPRGPKHEGDTRFPASFGKSYPCSTPLEDPDNRAPDGAGRRDGPQADIQASQSTESSCELRLSSHAFFTVQCNVFCYSE